MKIAIVTDSTVFLSEEAKNNENLTIIPLPVIIEGKSYDEHTEIAIEGFYDRMDACKEFPKTSQPSMGTLINLYEELADKGYDEVINIHLSSGISGMITTIAALAPTFEKIKIVPFDSLITCSPMGNMVEIALKMVEEGHSSEEIITKLNQVRDNTRVYLIVDDLNHLVRGGRLTNGAALIGSLLKIKPILTFDEGKIVVMEKIRSSKKAFAKAKKMLVKGYKEQERPASLFIIHAEAEEVAHQIKSEIEDQLNVEVHLSEFGPVVGTHVGRGTIGIGWAEL